MRISIHHFLFCFVLLILLVLQKANATHLRAGEITISRVSCTSLDFDITITVYTNTGSPVKFGQGILDFGDGSTPVNTPTIDNTLRPDLGPNIGTVKYTYHNHSFPGPGRYVISYYEHNRNAGILNMSGSVNTVFYVESVINIDPFAGCDNSPILTVPPIDKGCTGVAWFHNPGAYDPDGDSLSYEMTIPLMDKDVDVLGYSDPNSKRFYDAINANYGTANETSSGPPTFKIDAVTGTVTWDAPGEAGEYNIAFFVKEWRKRNGIWIQLGFVERDMQIIIEDCKNKRPEIKPIPDLCVEAGTVISQDIVATDPDAAPGDSLKMEAFSQILSAGYPSQATITPNPPVWQGVSAPTDQALLHFNWATTCADVKEQPYQVVFKVSDVGKPQLVDFKTWNIRVVAPAPKWVGAGVVLNPGTRTATLQWEPYFCSKDAATIQIWRRVDSYPFTPPMCVTGIPSYLGYKLVGEVPVSDTQFVDKGLSIGAQYCYRLLAIFPLPKGGESYVSIEKCIPPILADAPVITNVTIDVTDPLSGQVTVRWRPPFQINAAQFPPPYTYDLYRADGFTGNNNLVKVFPGQPFPDTVKSDIGVNTVANTYNYRVFLYSQGKVVDTSDVASTVTLALKPTFKAISLTWDAQVPWSNNTLEFPYHRIYRGEGSATKISDLTLIDSVNVNSVQYNYYDSGQYNSVPLNKSTLYCYAVMTRGSYGNPNIKAPLNNFSEITCTKPNDTIPPCKQKLTVKGIDCNSYVQSNACGNNLFSNTIIWTRTTDPNCKLDIAGYYLYVSPGVGGNYSRLQVNGVDLVIPPSDTSYVHANLPSFAQCYKLSAFDRAGTESKLSDPACFDNCPHYELPNVFTPNGDNCNEKFSAYSDRIQIDENGYGPCGKVDLLELRRKCVRFVQSVNLIVVNRWGKEVYTYQSGSENSIYIDWNGRDNNNVDLPTGVYYYMASIVFDVVDPKKKNQTLKGWVQLIR